MDIATTTAAAQSIAQKVAPAALEDVLNGLRSLSINFDNNNTTSTSTSTSTIDTTFAKKFCIPFDTIININEKGEKPFIACYYNKVPTGGGNSNSTTGSRYRSPWTNAIHPLQPDGIASSSTSSGTAIPKGNEKLRALEKSFNDVWDSYTHLYYGQHGGDTVSSVYLKEMSNASFQGMFGIRKRIDNTTTGGRVSKWDSVSYVIVDEPSSDNKECTYRVETYVRVVLVPNVGENEPKNNTSTKSTTTTTTDVSVSMSKETIATLKIAPDKIPINVSHIENVGTIIEENEMELRSVMESVYIPKNYETLVTLQKQPQPKQVTNPVMGIMMDSNVFKKRLASSNTGSTNVTIPSSSNEDGGISSTGSSKSPSTSTSSSTTRPKGIPVGVNPLMASAMNSKILLKKKQQQQQE